MAKESEKAKASATPLELKAPKNARESVAGLVRRFAEHREELKRKQNETEVRVSYINPFFEALGWDVRNTRGYAESYKDVVHEAAVQVEGKMKAPDYSFRIGGQRKFFLEAKAPSVDIEHDVSPAFQLRRYAWSAKLPVSLLTDFEELAVYQVNRRPMKKDKASVDRVAIYRFEEFPEKLDEIYSIFSKEAVLKGSFDRYAEGVRKKRGTAHVDDEFLREMEAWRVELAKNLALRNPGLGVEEMNFAVQAILDRILFLRIAEDRGIEDYGRLQNIAHGEKVYKRLASYFHDSDDRYNAGLFDFRKDTLTLKLKVDDKVLKHIILELYDPSPYVFDVIEADIFGSVYERFLGSVIRLTTGHHAKVEEKPEVRKAGGVYYTPRYIVDYIVEHTVGELLKGKTPKEVEKLRILDPACGSGSFLIGAYQRLLNWHLEWYSERNPKKHAREKNPKITEVGDGQWRLTIAERKRILLKNVFGVDIDSQAVEVTKLNLLLKVLEGGSRETIDADLKLFRERALPNIDENIKCGNSLIGTDFQGDLFGNSDANTFDWEKEFADIMERGGFDAVIGNPPYILLQDKFRDDAQLSYFFAKYITPSYKVDTYHLFLERAVKLTRNGGISSLITPSNFLTNNYLAKLRKYLLETTKIERLVIIHKAVFKGVSVDSAISVLTKSGRKQASFRIIHSNLHVTGTLREQEIEKVDIDNALLTEHVLFTGNRNKEFQAVKAMITSKSKPLSEISYVNFGKQLRNRKIYPKDVIKVKSKTLPKYYKRCVSGYNIFRYFLHWDKLACLDSKKAQRGGCWDSEKQNAKNKLLTRQIGKFPTFTIDAVGYQCLNTIFMVNVFDKSMSVKYVLGILNSKLIRAYWLNCFCDRRSIFPKIKGTYLKQLPVRTVDRSNPFEKNAHNKMVSLVERMLNLKKNEAKAKTPHAKETLSRQIVATDSAIDKLVYRLYGLTEEEIKVVEGE